MKGEKVKILVGMALCGGLVVSFFIGQSLKTFNETNQKSQQSKLTPAFQLENATKLTKSAPFSLVEKQEKPVLERGKEGEWDSMDLLNPSVLERDGIFYNYYSGFDGKRWSTGLATSKDGIIWEKYKNNPVLTLSKEGWDSQYIAANGSAVVFQNKVYYFYQGVNENNVTQIGLAISENGMDFTKQKSPVLSCGAQGEWDSQGVADPYVIVLDGKLYLYYLGMNQLSIQRLGVAVSTDGIHWTKSNANPIMDVGVKGSFDENGLGEPSVYYEAPYFYMLYTGRNAEEMRNIGLAYSMDGINWYKNNYDGLFTLQEDSWDSKVICDTTMLYHEKDKQLYVWFGGGDKAEPAEHLDGNVGLFKVDISQNRDMYNFDTEADWSKSLVSSEDVLQGSYKIENGQAWVSDNLSIDLKNAHDKNTIILNGFMPFDNYKAAKIDKVKLSVYVNNTLANETEYTEDGQIEIKITKSKEMMQSENLSISIVSDSGVIPAQVGLGQDERKLAFVLKKIVQE